MSAIESLFKPGHNCLEVARASRAALLVDAEEYFKAFASAALGARRSLVIVGWDFHSRVRLHHGLPGIPDHLGDFLNYLVERRRGLKIRVLIWDYPMLFAKGRELSPSYGLGWRPRRRVRVRYDDYYPVGASQHQKLVVIDGELAFCGGLDLTQSRWDTREHRAGDARRMNEGASDLYAPFHDTMIAVDGEAAGLLSAVVRERWWRATGRRISSRQNLLRRAGARMRAGLNLHVLHRPPPVRDPWPKELPISLRDVRIAVSRTVAPFNGEPPVREIEAMYLELIAAAKQTIYIENQYFTSNSLGEALAARLREPEGPQIVAVLRFSTSGWLEAPTMGTLRNVLLRKLREADRFNRFHAYYPHIPGLPEGQFSDLHSKLLIVDDDYLLIGSANFSNRSMGLDTECVTVAEGRGNAAAAAGIRGFRHGLIAEHLGVTAQDVERTIQEQGSIKAAIEALSSEGRVLKPYDRIDEPSPALVSLALNVADPEQPVSLDSLIVQFASERRDLGGWPRRRLLAGGLLVLLALAALWRYTPLAGWADVWRVVEWAESFSGGPWGPLLITAAYIPASIVLFPRSLITLFAVVAFGPLCGFVCAFSGILLAALATYLLGLRLDQGAVRRIAGQRLARLTRIMREQGLLAMTAVRLVPLAPFPVVNMVAGAIRVPPWQFLLGSALGILPGTVVAILLGGELAQAAHHPRSVHFMTIAVALLALLAGIWVGRSWLLRRK